MKKKFLAFALIISSFACSDDEKNHVAVSSCDHTVYTGTNNCDAGYVAVPGGCCPSTHPWYCSGKCYLYCTDAKKVCSNVVKGV